MSSDFLIELEGLQARQHELTFLEVPPPYNARCVRCEGHFETVKEWLEQACPGKPAEAPRG